MSFASFVFRKMIGIKTVVFSGLNNLLIHLTILEVWRGLSKVFSDGIMYP